MKYILLCLLVTSCAGAQSPTTDPNCTGQSGKVYSCSEGSCSHTGGTGCSLSVDGVACCNNGNTGNSDGTNNCALGFCWTNPENICCPQNAQYACKGFCYTTNVCNYNSYQSACHSW